MLKSILKITAVGLLAAACAGLPLQVAAQTTNKPTPAKKSAADKATTADKKQGSLPYKGNLGEIDKLAKTITVGKRTFQITSETKLYRGDKPATLDDGVKGEYVTLSYRETEDGKYLARNVYFGGKSGKGSSKKADTIEKSPK